MSSYALFDWIMASKLNLIIVVMVMATIISLPIFLKPECQHCYQSVKVKVCKKCGEFK